MARQMAAKIAGNAPLVVRALKKLAREAMPKGPLETVADVRRLLDEAREGRAPSRVAGAKPVAGYGASVNGQFCTADCVASAAQLIGLCNSV